MSLRDAARGWRRGSELGLIAAAGLAVAARVAHAGGAPRELLHGALWLSALAALAAIVLPGPPPRWIDRWRLPLVLCGLALLPGVYDRLKGDGPEYYALLRSPLLDRDLDFANDYAGLGAPEVRTADGRLVSRVAIGQALLWLPPFIAVHAAASAAAAAGLPVTADGFSPIYPAAMTTANFVYGFLALLGIEALVRRRFGPGVAAAATILTLLATPVHFYLTANPFMSHGTQILVATLLVAAWIGARASDSARAWAGVGLLAGLAAALRPQDVILFALPGLDLLTRATPWRERLRLLAALAAGPALLALLQVLAWLGVYGADFFTAVRGDNLFGQQGLHVVELLSSPRHGLLSWTPLYAASLLGWLLWLRPGHDRRLAALTWATFALAVLTNAAMVDWWGSESFGQRRMLSLTPLYALGLAEALRFGRRQPWVPIGLLALGLVAWNQQFMVLYNSERLAPRQQAITLEQLAAGHVELATERLLRVSPRLPEWLWVPLYDNLSGVWIDSEPRSLQGRVDLGSEAAAVQRLVAGGWYKQVQTDGDRRFRHTRGRAASLRVPIRHRAPLTIEVECRSEMGAGTPLFLALDVNGGQLGEQPVPPDWGRVSFVVPAHLVRVGLNEITLLPSTTPRRVLGHDVRNAALGVAALHVRRDRAGD